MVSSERASQEEQNSPIFSSIAPSSEEQRVRKEIWSKCLYYSNTYTCTCTFSNHHGLYAIMPVCMQVEVGDVVRRLLPHRLEVWGRKRERRLARRALAKEKRLKEWVSTAAAGKAMSATHTEGM